MKKTILWMLLAILSGAFLGKFTFDKYEKLNVQNVISYDNYVYMLKRGTYKSYEVMTKNMSSFERYVFIEENDKYKTYIAISKNKETIDKVKKIYDDKNIKLSVVKEKIDNEEFIQNLNEYEKLLSAVEDEKSILVIENQILSCYEDLMVIKDE